MVVSAQRTAQPRLRARRWVLAEKPRPCIAYVVAIDALAVAVVGYLFATMSVSGADLGRFAIMLSLFAVFQKISAHIERLRIRVADSHHIDMTSVWTFGGAVALPSSLAVGLVLAIALFLVASRHKAGVEPYRQVIGAANIILPCAAASAILHHAPMHAAHLPLGALQALTLFVAMAVYTSLNAGLVGVFIYLRTGVLDARSILGTSEENILELATLCLGAITALVSEDAPWLTALAIVPMVVLQRGALIKQLEVAATTDRKTGLLNAVAWRQVVVKELARAERDAGVGTMFILDMDRFKAVNDDHGHLVGDAVLKAVATCLKEELRGYDSLGRFGGEEFVAFLPDVDSLMATAVSDRILDRIRKLEVPSVAAPDIRLNGFSASMGVAIYPDHGNEVQALLHAADLALYAAKAGGRDRAEFVSTSI